MRATRCVFVLVTSCAVLTCDPAYAQCGPRWLAETPTQPLSLGAASLVRHPDGSVYAGGQFSQAGGVSTTCIARWDGVAWSAVNTAMTPGAVTPRVHALAVMPNGDLIAAGHFGSAGGVTANHIARWNGTSWSALGGGVSGASSGNNPSVFSLLPLPNGDLIVGGEFTMAGTTPAMRIARWDGTTWHAMGAGFGSTGSYSPVYCLVRMPNGDIVAGGQFSFSGALSLGRIASWNGSAWTPLSSGVSNGAAAAVVRSLALAPDGALIVAGRFGSAGTVASRSVARWDGVAWSGIGGGVGSIQQHEAVAMVISPEGEITLGGTFSSAGGGAASAIARWDGTSWFTFSGGVTTGTTTAPNVSSLLLLPGGEMLASGGFLFAGGTPSTRFARWTDTGLPMVQNATGPTHAACDEALAYTATLAGGYANATARWQVENPPASGVWQDLVDGSNALQGVHVADAAGTTTLNLSLTPRSGFAPTRVRCGLTNACGVSHSEAFAVESSCPPACDGDVNCDFALDGFDVEVQEKAVGGDTSDYCQPDPDFNRDFALDGFDVEAVELVVGGGPCP